MPRSRNLSERDDLKRLVWAATEWWAISTAPGAPPLREHPLVSSLLFHNIFGFHRELLTLNDNDIDTMTTPMFRPDGTFDGTRPMSIQDKNHLKIARAFYNFVCYQVGEDVDVLTLSRDQYDDFRLNEYDFSTPTKPWRTLVEEENKRKVGEWNDSSNETLENFQSSRTFPSSRSGSRKLSHGYGNMDWKHTYSVTTFHPTPRSIPCNSSTFTTSWSTSARK